MRILFTGATSFTGMWFVETLARDGHDIVAAIRGDEGTYSGLRAERLTRVAACCRPIWNTSFGSPRFLDLIAQEGPFEVLCHHAAQVTGYQDADFDAIAAAGSNTRSLRPVLQVLADAGCQRIVLTGSIFEAGEGAGSTPLRAFNSYGLSKTLTWQLFSFHAEQEGLALGKFVIPNPFGPYAEARFTDYLVRCWRAQETGVVRTPRYVRDNIHVSLLAAVYAHFVRTLPRAGVHKINPSGYVETQGAFAARFAREMSARLNIEVPLEFGDQAVFTEPPVRINTDVFHDIEDNWTEHEAWAELANYYAERYNIGHR